MFKKSLAASVVFGLIIPIFFANSTVEIINMPGREYEPISEVRQPTWKYRRSISIYNTNPKSLEDYQVLVTLNTKDLISSGKMRLGCSDMRFTDSSAKKQLKFWLEGGCNIPQTKVWVKVPFIPANSSTVIYVYYGNPDALNVMDGAGTFDFFDDFWDSGYANNPIWTQEDNCAFGGGDIKVADNFPQYKVLQLTRTSPSCGSGITAPFNEDYGVWHVRLKKTAGNDVNGIQFYPSYGGNGNYVLSVNYSDGVRLDGPSGQIGSSFYQPIGDWHAYDIARDLSGKWTVFIDGVPRITGKDNVGTMNAKIGVRTLSWDGSSTDYADDIFFRKYASKEPTVGLENEVNSSQGFSIGEDLARPTFVIESTPSPEPVSSPEFTPSPTPSRNATPTPDAELSPSPDPDKAPSPSPVPEGYFNSIFKKENLPITLLVIVSILILALIFIKFMADIKDASSDIQDK